MPHLQRGVLTLAVAIAALAATAARAAGPEAYALDPVHTRVMFAVEHAGFSQALGTVSGSTGSLLFDPDDWRSARLDVSVPLTRLELGDAKWNTATLGASLLDGRRYPLARFVSSSVEAIEVPASGASHQHHASEDQPRPEQLQESPTQRGAEAAGEAAAGAAAAGTAAAGRSDRPRARVCGELTLRNVTRPLCLDVTFNALKRYPLPPFRRTAGFSATATLSRSEFGIDAWASVIGDRVELRIEAEATRDDAAAAAFAVATQSVGTPTAPMGVEARKKEVPDEPSPSEDIPQRPAAASRDDRTET